MHIEQALNESHAIYISRIEFNQENKELIFRLLNNPEEQDTETVELTFFDIKNFSDQVDPEELDEDYLDSIIGIQEIPQKNEYQYFIQTEQRLIQFSTRKQPHLKILG